MKTTGRILSSSETGQRVERGIHRLQRTLGAARLLQSTLDLRELTTIILEIVRNEVPVDRATAFIVDHKKNLVRSLVAQGLPDFVIELPIGEGIAGFVAKTRQVLDVPDAYADGRFDPEFDRILKYRTNDILALPILNHDGRVVGVLELLNRKSPITEGDREFLQDVSVFIGLALENARLYEEVQHKVRLEEELAKSRERLAQVDRQVLVGEVLSTVAKELLTPLSVITTYTALLKLDPDVTSSMARNIGILESATMRSKETVTQFVNWIQKEKGDRTPVDLKQLVSQTVASRAFQWSLDRIEADEHLQDAPTVIASYAEIQQALINLIRNGEDAVISNPGPRRLAIRLFHEKTRDNVRIDVADNGPGIPTELYERIFEPFFSTKQGTARAGLGLTIANRIIQEHQGEILFETGIGQGTTFSIELPAGGTPVKVASSERPTEG